MGLVKHFEGRRFMIKFGVAMRVKSVARMGWMMRGIPPSDSETVGSHSFEVSVLAMIVADKLRNSGIEVDVSKVLRLALLHDIAESVMGDIVRSVKESMASSRQLEEAALKELGMDIYIPLLHELFEGKTLEALLVKLCDNLATLLQGLRYLNKGYTSVIDIVDAVKQQVDEILSSEVIPEDAKNILGDVTTRLIVAEEV